MSARRLLNLVYAHLMKGLDEKQKDNIHTLLREPFDHEVTPEEAARMERRRIAMRMGAYSGQAGLVGAFGMKSR